MPNGFIPNERQRQIEALIEKYEKTVYKLAYSYLRNKQDADDIYQEVFLRYFRKKPEFADGEHEKAWFFKAFIRMFFRFWILRYGIVSAIPHFLSKE